MNDDCQQCFVFMVLELIDMKESVLVVQDCEFKCFVGVGCLCGCLMMIVLVFGFWLVIIVG